MEYSLCAAATSALGVTMLNRMHEEMVENLSLAVLIREKNVLPFTPIRKWHKGKLQAVLSIRESFGFDTNHETIHSVPMIEGRILFSNEKPTYFETTSKTKAIALAREFLKTYNNLPQWSEQEWEN